MPVDGILVGTAAMASMEATTSPAVKQLLVDTPGTDHWVGAGKAEGGMASGRSQLGADIHEIDNAASRCGRLLDEVAGDADAVAARREEIIAAMAATAKPYFGDVAEMTYRQWLPRYVELAIGDGDSTADTKPPTRPVAGHHLARPVRRDAAARRGPSAPDRHRPHRHPVRRRRAAAGEPRRGHRRPAGALPRRRDRAAASGRRAVLHQLCKTPGKPVNFVPVIDKDVRRWWRSDSLWQAHDARYDADQVCIIPGTDAVAGITRVDEPVGELLDRFEQAAIDEVLASGAAAAPVASRRQVPHRRGRPAGHRAGLARRAVGRSHRDQPGAPHRRPRRLAGARQDPKPPLPHTIPRARGCDVDAETGRAERAAVGDLDRHRIHLARHTVDGGAPVVSAEDAATAMRAVLAIAAGVDGPESLPPVDRTAPPPHRRRGTPSGSPTTPA